MRITIRLPGTSVVASHASRAGIVAASANVASTFGRGLLPRSVTDQAIITGVCTAAMYQAATTAHAGAETLAHLTSGQRRSNGTVPSNTRVMVADLSFVALGVIADQLIPPRSDEHLAISGVRFAAESLMLGGAAGAVVSAVDNGLGRVFPGDTLVRRPLIVDVGLGAAAAATTVWIRHRHAREFGLVDPKRRAVKKAGLRKLAKAVAFGTGAAAGMTALAVGEGAAAGWIKRSIESRAKRIEVAAPLIAHGIALGALGVGIGAGYFVAKRRVERSGDVLEPAYPEPPTSSYVTAGPKSLIGFDTIGKEGRRFVLMALDADEISAVMGEPAENPIRIVGGYEAVDNSEQLARLCLREMEALGAFDRSLICIASPTGVGYVSYTFAESLEYLTRGDCAIVVPQYALVPSALALFDTYDGVALQRRVLQLCANRISQLPVESRPTLVQFGESLGAQVALDVACPGGVAELDRLGMAAGLYLGVPFRSKAWKSWRADAAAFDPNGQLICVAEPAELPEELRGGNAHPAASSRHIMVVHDDDPVNKFSYALVVRPPWWMGPPATRPPKVPRETIWRPVTTFMMTVIDLFNGMEFKPGEFVRRGHDYRIDSCDATSAAYGLPCSPAQSAAIGEALKQREQDWAARRLVARKFAGARDSITRTLKTWGVSISDISAADPEASPIVADIDPRANLIPKRLGSSGVL